MLDLELRVEFCDHNVVDIGTIFCDDSLGDAIPTYEVMLNESSYHILSDRGERGCFNLFFEVVNGNKNEMMSIRSSRLDLSDHINAPHCEWPQRNHDIQRYQRHMNFISIDLALMTSSRVVVTIVFHGRPIVIHS